MYLVLFLPYTFFSLLFGQFDALRYTSYYFFSLGIISDLFPRVEIPIVDYGIMEQSIRNMLVKRGYDDMYSKFMHLNI